MRTSSALLTVIGLTAALAGCGRVTPAEDPFHDRGDLRPGQKVTLKAVQGQAADALVPAARSAAAFNELNLCMKAKDTLGMRRLVDAGAVLAIRKPTAALYLQPEYDASVIRLTAGPHRGEKVWVYPFSIR